MIQVARGVAAVMLPLLILLLPPLIYQSGLQLLPGSSTLKNGTLLYNDEASSSTAPEDNENLLNKEDYDPAILQNHLLLRPRPRNLSLVFVGDSLSRFQYLSLAYFLRHGRWWDLLPHDALNNLVSAHSFHHPHHPHDDWNEFFLQSNRLLYPMEICDCQRAQNITQTTIERRYFYDKTRNNRLVYIHLNGNETHGSWGYYGRLHPETVFAEFESLVGMVNETNPTNNDRATSANATTNKFAWEYGSWGDILRYHVGALGLCRHENNSTSSCRVILNAGLHPNDFSDTDAVEDVAEALRSIHTAGVWKTTTYAVSDVRHVTLGSDKLMCAALGDCFNLSWTARVLPEFYVDRYHFHEPVYRILNEELLQHLQALPSNYPPLLHRSVVLEKSL